MASDGPTNSEVIRREEGLWSRQTLRCKANTLSVNDFLKFCHIGNDFFDTRVTTKQHRAH